ncbi:hypothetical protein [Mesobacillus zeae]|uniref:hypothetical protein n=1 Tax=Mesobacillus zeae TaxID=1917180 RepID=UPI0015E6E05E|nr:hypothetical protein [Mesobacillus zeae]
MKKNQERKQQANTNVEFGMEFGDINASKMYEQPFPEKKHPKKNNKTKAGY